MVRLCVARTVGVAASVLSLTLLAGCGTKISAIATVTGAPDSDRLALGVLECKGEHEAVVGESSEAVTIEVVTKRRLQVGGGRQACMDRIVITLERALGDRTVIDASTGEALDVGS